MASLCQFGDRDMLPWIQMVLWVFKLEKTQMRKGRGIQEGESDWGAVLRTAAWGLYVEMIWFLN